MGKMIYDPNLKNIQAKYVLFWLLSMVTLRSPKYLLGVYTIIILSKSGARHLPGVAVL
ncbi:hypothetical protein [Paenibacillus macerans]|uniref:hypothetical protein n=1 Tax=Paenibacillus macerans TaxID=44252 RepID=UPI003D315E50